LIEGRLLWIPERMKSEASSALPMRTHISDCHAGLREPVREWCAQRVSSQERERALAHHRSSSIIGGAIHMKRARARLLNAVRSCCSLSLLPALIGT
jgi:hypothetical protein